MCFFLEINLTNYNIYPKNIINLHKYKNEQNIKCKFHFRLNCTLNISSYFGDHITSALSQDDRGNPTHWRSSFEPSSCGSLANRNVSAIATNTEPPCSFQKPRRRFDDGLKQLADQHNLAFQPPMPKPPLFATW